MVSLSLGAAERIIYRVMTFFFFGEVRTLRERMNGDNIKEEKKVDYVPSAAGKGNGPPFTEKCTWTRAKLCSSAPSRLGSGFVFWKLKWKAEVICCSLVTCGAHLPTQELDFSESIQQNQVPILPKGQHWLLGIYNPVKHKTGVQIRTSHTFKRNPTKVNMRNWFHLEIKIQKNS